MHAQEVALQDQRRQMILAQQRIDEDRAAQRLLGKLDDNDDHVQVRDLDQKHDVFSFYSYLMVPFVSYVPR